MASPLHLKQASERQTAPEPHPKVLVHNFCLQSLSKVLPALSSHELVNLCVWTSSYVKVAAAQVSLRMLLHFEPNIQ